MKALLFALLLPAIAHAHPREGYKNLPIDEAYLVICTAAESVYFIRPTRITHSMKGLNGAPDCFAAIDTEGEGHMLCHEEGSSDRCVLARPGPAI